MILTEAELKAMEERIKSGDDCPGRFYHLSLTAEKDAKALISEVRALWSERADTREEVAAGRELLVKTLDAIVGAAARMAPDHPLLRQSQEGIARLRAIVNPTVIEVPGHRIHLGGGLEVEVCEGCYQRMKPSLTGGPDAEAHGGGTP